MRHYFLDTNVVLDFLARREPFAAAALEIFQAGLERRAVLYVASLSFSTVHYVIRRQSSAPQALALVADLAKLVSVVGVDAGIVQRAIAGTFADFEDGLRHYAAVSVSTVEAIITRNPRDFSSSLLPVLTPQQATVQL